MKPDVANIARDGRLHGNREYCRDQRAPALPVRVHTRNTRTCIDGGGKQQRKRWRSGEKKREKRKKTGDCNYQPFRDQAVVGVSSVNSATASHLSSADEIPSVHGENVIAPFVYIIVNFPLFPSPAGSSSRF